MPDQITMIIESGIIVAAFGAAALILGTFISSRKPKAKKNEYLEYTKAGKFLGWADPKLEKKQTIRLPSDKVLKSDDSQSNKSTLVPSQIGSLDVEQLDKDFKEFDDEYYEKAQKITNLEVSHSFESSQKQLDLQIEKEKRGRLVGGFS